MGQIKRRLSALSLRQSMALYLAVFALLALSLSVATAAACSAAQERLWSAYPPANEKYFLTNAAGERLGDGVYIGAAEPLMTPSDEKLMALYSLFPTLLPPLYSVLCLLSAVLLFYRNRLKKPLAALMAASEKIAQNDLDFTVAYAGQDELGRLCASFETMRAALSQNFSAMWRQVEDRQALNAAFAHQLRTPLTVLRGYDEMLCGSANASTRATALTMARQLSRLEGYVDSMSRLQRLEDAQPAYAETALPPFLASLHESAALLAQRGGKKLLWQARALPGSACLDPSFLTQVCQNLLSNALRYAASSVSVVWEGAAEGLILTVCDDGGGFAPQALARAAEPYYTQEQDRSVHFGLGLYLCKTLCERHAGTLTVENSAAGGRVTAFFRCGR